MFNSPIINLIILLSFTYFIGSLMLSSINEFIAAIFRMRQNHLKKSLEGFFFSAGWKSFVKNHFFKSPHIQSLMKAANKYPAYISASNFVSVIIEQIGPANFNAGSIAAALNGNTVLPQEMKTVILNLLAKTQNDINKFEKELGDFYDEAMDRVTGWYKRKVRTIMLFVSIALAVVLNLDTIKISNDALSDTGKLEKAVDNITAEMSKMNIVNDTLSIKDSSGKVFISMITKIDTSSRQTADNAKQNFKGIQIIYEQTTGYQLGYKTMDDFGKDWKDNWPLKIIGVLITMFALQLGANYWFDLLNKVVNLRAAGKNPDEKNK